MSDKKSLAAMHTPKMKPKRTSLESKLGARKSPLQKSVRKAPDASEPWDGSLVHETNVSKKLDEPAVTEELVVMLPEEEAPVIEESPVIESVDVYLEDEIPPFAAAPLLEAAFGAGIGTGQSVTLKLDAEVADTLARLLSDFAKANDRDGTLFQAIGKGEGRWAVMCEAKAKRNEAARARIPDVAIDPATTARLK